MLNQQTLWLFLFSPQLKKKNKFLVDEINCNTFFPIYK